MNKLFIFFALLTIASCADLFKAEYQASNPEECNNYCVYQSKKAYYSYTEPHGHAKAQFHCTCCDPWFQ